LCICVVLVPRNVYKILRVPIELRTSRQVDGICPFSTHIFMMKGLGVRIRVVKRRLINLLY
jgi:hypothetical protein